ncbi:MAG: type II toxin-antitoxin system HigB family toxin [Gammaproteobacteria bacterium]|nr:type II toxin-antitoxin system HigB family toxin [Gammaproteobacteria bacterium]
MKIVGRSRLEAFCDRHAAARKWIEHWLSEVEAARWTTPQEIRARYASASFLADNLVIFNVKGNDYRLETRLAYQTSVVVVTWVGTHAEYDQRNRKR